MSRYIDVHKLAKVYMEKGKDKLELATVMGELELAPTADVVETAHCEACKKVAELERRLDEAQLILFAVVRNSAVLPLGSKLGKTEKEISEMTFMTIDEIKKCVDYAKMRKVMKLANRKDEETVENGNTDADADNSERERECHGG